MKHSLLSVLLTFSLVGSLSAFGNSTLEKAIQKRNKAIERNDGAELSLKAEKVMKHILRRIKHSQIPSDGEICLKKSFFTRFMEPSKSSALLILTNTYSKRIGIPHFGFLVRPGWTIDNYNDGIEGANNKILIDQVLNALKNQGFDYVDHFTKTVRVYQSSAEKVYLLDTHSNSEDLKVLTELCFTVPTEVPVKK